MARVSMKPVYDALRSLRQYRPQRYREFVAETAQEEGVSVPYGASVEEAAYILTAKISTKHKISRDEAAEMVLSKIQTRTGLLLLLAELG